jgi:hypothetical protein
MDLEQLAPGVTFERVDNIYVLTLGDLSRASIDAWADKLQQLLDVHPEDQVFLTLHHFANPYAVLTPYLKARSEQLRNVRTFSHAAIVLPKTGPTQMVAAASPQNQSWKQFALLHVAGRGSGLAARTVIRQMMGVSPDCQFCSHRYRIDATALFPHVTPL